MTQLEAALSLAARGFHVFPVLPKGVGYRDRNGKDQISDGKHPAVSGWQEWATTSEVKIQKRWSRHAYNVGISTSRYGEDKALAVVDVDVKKGKRGDLALLRLEMDGFEFPTTLENETPSSGRHLVYVVDHALQQGTDVLGVGLDIRSKGGFIVAPGSEIDGVPYRQISQQDLPSPAPEWLVAKLGVPKQRSLREKAPLPNVDPERAMVRAVEHLEKTPGAALGSRGSTAYKVAARLKDLGCTRDVTLFLMDQHWVEKCDPPMPSEDLEDSVNHAFTYGKEQPGSAAPEAVFTPAEDSTDEDDDEAPKGTHPFEKLNQEYAFIKRGAFVLQETTDSHGRYTTEHLDVAAFHAWHANQPLRIGDKSKPVSKWWMESPRRRQYEGVVFMPNQDPGPRFFNLWRGFAVQAAEKADPKHPALAAFLEHALKNVCRGDKDLCRWLLGYFAHMIQRPNEKPLVALVFKGRKGTGKNALVERVGYLLGAHALVADDDRYLLSNFNAHLETNLFFVLDEATWAGDKKAEGRLKGLITGTEHLIERKGAEPYRADNLTRVAILGNEDWMVPASHDERRFAVFEVGEGRMQDRKFFEDMRKGMEQGGYAHLLRFLQEFDLSTVDVNDAPRTQALLDQKLASLDPMPQWWMECLMEGRILGADFSETWPERITAEKLREAHTRWLRSKNIRSRGIDAIAFGRQLRKLAPSFVNKNAHVNGRQIHMHHSPGLNQLRDEWDAWVGGMTAWIL